MIPLKINDDAISAALARGLAQLDNMQPVMKAIGEQLVVSTKDRFKTGEAPDGTKWAPNSPVTLARKKGTRPLFGNSPVAAGLNSQIFASTGPDYVEVGSNKVQAAVMHFGAEQGAFGAFIGKDKRGRDHFHSIPWGRIPARPFLGISNKHRANIEDTVSEALAAAFTP